VAGGATALDEVGEHGERGCRRRNVIFAHDALASIERKALLRRTWAEMRFERKRVCVCVCACVCVVCCVLCVCVYVCMCVSVCLCLCVRVCTCTLARARVCVCVRGEKTRGRRSKVGEEKEVLNKRRGRRRRKRSKKDKKEEREKRREEKSKRHNKGKRGRRVTEVIFLPHLERTSAADDATATGAHPWHNSTRARCLLSHIAHGARVLERCTVGVCSSSCLSWTEQCASPRLKILAIFLVRCLPIRFLARRLRTRRLWWL
jgi:hypothetical protein